MLQIFSNKGKTVKKWRSRAWSIDPKKTKLTLLRMEPAGHVPPWIQKAYHVNY